MQLIIKKTTSSPVEQRGLSLLEVLVTIVILSLGILGVAGLQNAALRNAHSALLHAQAAQYAYDIIDRMRANRAEAVAGNYNRTLTPASTEITGTSLVERDQREWFLELRSLPDAQGEISVTAEGDVRVTVQWSEAAIGGSTAEFVIKTRI
ncbi:MAG: type IV pilus modification protein PilV [Thiobacillaceae bacterium]